VASWEMLPGMACSLMHERRAPLTIPRSRSASGQSVNQAQIATPLSAIMSSNAGEPRPL
jgi:hypothetical protein